MIKDGLWDAFNGYHMGTTAENVAQQWQITREQQDQFAAGSQRKAAAAQAAGRFKDEIVPVTVKTRKGDVVVDPDEHLKPGTTAETLAKLRPAFSKDGTITAGNASGLNDGAAVTVLMTRRRGATARARAAGADRVVGDRGGGPGDHGHRARSRPRARRWRRRAGRSDDLDLVEANEAFAAQACAVNKDMGWDPARVNVNGGAIALGHPIGASGNRVLVTLLHEMQRRGAKKGLATLCIGGGMGIALCVERG